MVSAKTKAVGLLGYPVSHSFSPLLHNAAFHALGLDWIYLAFAVEPSALPAAVAGLRALGFAGANVTIPHKETVMAWLDEIDPLARLIGAVNTIVVRDGRLAGYNTDGSGFRRSLEEAGVDPAGKRALVLGAGGAARAVVFTLVQSGCAGLLLVNRTSERAHELARAVEAFSATPIEVLPWEDRALAEAMPGVDLIINTTSIGMSPHQEGVPLDPELLQPHHLVYDLVYNPLETRLLAAARRRGCRTVSGLGMLLYQGAEAFTLWTGREAPLEVMRETLNRWLMR